MTLQEKNEHWAKPNAVILMLVIAAILERRWHFFCLLRMAWLNKREWYVFDELGGFRNWLWYVWQWMVEYIDYEPGKCEFCSETLPKSTFTEKVKYIFS
jgi:hypothetical protein